MTNRTNPVVAAPAGAAAVRPGAGRITAGIVAVAAILPYLALKTVWSFGGTIGLADIGAADEDTLRALNLLTFGMDLVALVLALAFTRPWGLRLPVWLVILPMWVGTGFLAPIAILVPIQVLILGAEAETAGGPVQPWVYAVVYTGFVVQGLALMTAFALYARDRWPWLFVAGGTARGATYSLQVVLAWGAGVFCVGIGALRLLWAFGGTVGLPGWLVAEYDATVRTQTGVFGLACLVAAAGLAGMLRGGPWPFWIPLAAAWGGAGVMFSWSIWSTALTLIPNPFGGPVRLAAVPALTDLFATLAAVVVGLTAAFLLAERAALAGQAGEGAAADGS
ncbi:hypothetical protein [Thermostaphylospora chromogena]|uniref:LigA protein n=1 Tax=Thermostaphylospora chromogena TaxID=35622 RepID=A0A1H1FCT9_9ACTN|nr:hypothetical protein [Thermostaphylospora chromogena]SDQ98276.1 hypothetical protein SAMN04489764_2896 [Thermostaphylospora chromogena]